MSDMKDQEKQLVEWLSDMNEDDALALAKRMLLEEGADPLRVLELCRMAMDIVGKRFEQDLVRHPEARTLEASMDAGWKILGGLPKSELARLSDAQIERYIDKAA